MIRRGAAVLLLWLPAAVILITWTLWNDRLPSELPTHWGGSGPADAVTATTVLFGWLIAIAAVAALVGSILLLVPLRGAWTQRAIGAVCAAVGAIVLSMWLGSAASSIGVSDPYTVELGAWVLLAFIAPAYGLVPLVLLPRGTAPPVTVQNTTPVEPFPQAPTQTAAWSRTISSGLFLAATALMLALGVALFIPLLVWEGVGAVGWAMIPYAGAVMLVAAFCSFRVTADRRGLRVTSTLLGIPLKRIAPESIATVEAAELDPLQWGGWGYRIMPGRSAIILRKGPGLVITQTNNKQFAITLDHPDEPAGILLNLVVDRRGE